jgi:hypothetical protein
MEVTFHALININMFLFEGVPTKSLSKTQQAAAQMAQSADGRLTCIICQTPVSVNPNSLDVHAKTHLNFKQHQCGYCSYRSCMSAKVRVALH